jgi:hypothetical protein
VDSVLQNVHLEDRVADGRKRLRYWGGGVFEDRLCE